MRRVYQATVIFLLVLLLAGCAHKRLIVVGAVATAATITAVMLTHQDPRPAAAVTPVPRYPLMVGGRP